MKKFLIIVWVFTALKLSAQDIYYVTVVKGAVAKKAFGLNQSIKVGDSVSSNDRIIVTSKNDFLIVINKNGRFKISINESGVNNSTELMNFFLKDYLHIHAENIRLSSRSGSGVSLADYFDPLVINGEDFNKRTIINDELKIPLNNVDYGNSNNREQFFFLQLQQKNGSVVNNKLQVHNDSLQFRKTDFIFNNKLYSDSDGSLKLGFIKNFSGEKQTKEIATIYPVFVSNAEILRLVETLKIAMPDSDKNDIINEIYTELYFFYGKPNRMLLQNIYEKQY